MKRISLHIILPLIIAFAAISIFAVSDNHNVPTAGAATLAEQKNQLGVLKDRYTEATENTRILREQLAATQGQKKSNLERKKELDEEIRALTEQIVTAEYLITEYDTAIAEKNAEKENLEKKKAEQHKTLGEMLKTSYMYGDESYIDLILGSKDIGDFLQRMDFISYHMKYSETLIHEMEDTSSELEEVTESLESTRAAMDTLKAELEVTRSELEPKLAEVDALIIELESDETYISSKLEQEQKDTETLEADITALEEQIAKEEAKKKKEEEERKKREEEERKRKEAEASKKNNQTTSNNNTPTQYPNTSSAGAGDGKLIWPLKTQRPSSSSYGWRTDPINGSRAFHNGLDIPAPYRTPILAAESGTVTLAKYYGTYGNCVMIDHGNGLVTLYAHCSGYNVKVGQKVTQGDVVAFVGSTGRSTGNHLHFVVRINGQYKDPNHYLPKR